MRSEKLAILAATIRGKQCALAKIAPNAVDVKLIAGGILRMVAGPV
jgi:hypothetical protein